MRGGGRGGGGGGEERKEGEWKEKGKKTVAEIQKGGEKE